MKEGAGRLFVIVSGIPASGKSTLGRQLAAELRLSFHDKDDILEQLFEGEGTGDAAWRQRLSRRSDEELRRRVRSAAGAVVVSFWRTARTRPGSGTPVEWLRELPGRVCEVRCRCDPAIAATRFAGRRRHAGHLDGQKPAVDAVEFGHLASAGPLGVGEMMVVDTTAPCDLGSIVAEFRATFDG